MRCKDSPEPPIEMPQATCNRVVEPFQIEEHPAQGSRSPGEPVLYERNVFSIRQMEPIFGEFEPQNHHQQRHQKKEYAEVDGLGSLFLYCNRIGVFGLPLKRFSPVSRISLP